MRLPAGTFEWIDTGDPMPAGADTVVMREWLLPQEDGSLIIAPADGAAGAAAGRATRARAERPAGGRGLRGRGGPGARRAAAAPRRPGRRRGRRARDLAVVAGGRSSRSSRPGTRSGRSGPTPRSATSSTPTRSCSPRGAVSSARCPLVSEVMPDDPDALAAEIRRARADADLVLVIAGSSRGRGDHAAAVLAQVGGVAVTGVAVRPGHPALLGHAKRPGHPRRHRAGIAPVIGLPGYPLATAVIFELFAAPLLAALTGRRLRGTASWRALDRDWASPRRRRGLGAGDARPRDAATAAVPVATPGQARGGLDQPARPGRRLVADPGRPGHLHVRHPRSRSSRSPAHRLTPFAAAPHRCSRTGIPARHLAPAR